MYVRFIWELALFSERKKKKFNKKDGNHLL